MTETLTPTRITLLQKSRCLELEYENNEVFQLSCEYLRTHSPSAEVKGHGNQKPNLVAGKHNVNIIGIDPVGNYALKFCFDDEHDTGIFSFDYLYGLAKNHEQNWKLYLARLEQEGKSRD